MLDGRSRLRPQSALWLPVRSGLLPLPHRSHGWSAYPRAIMHGMIAHILLLCTVVLRWFDNPTHLCQGYPYQLPHTSEHASDDVPNRRIPYTRSVASDCGGKGYDWCPQPVRLLFCLPCHMHAPANQYTAYYPSIQTLLRLTPAGLGIRTTRVSTPYGYRYGIRPPVWPCGFSPWHSPPPPPGWACSQTGDQPRHSIVPD